MIVSFLVGVASMASQGFIVERIPSVPDPRAQFRLILRTPGHSCDSWRKVTAIIPKDDLLVSESRRDEKGKAAGCRFLWVIKPAEFPGVTRLELEPFGGGAKELLEVSSQGILQVPSQGPPKVGGIADENGYGLANSPLRGGLRLTDPVAPALPSGDSKLNDAGTGK